MTVRNGRDPGTARRRLLLLAVVAALAAASVGVAGTATAAPGKRAAAAASCSVGQSGAAVPSASSGRSAVRTTVGVAKAMGVPVKGQIIAVMVMFQESSIRNLANDGSSTQSASWPVPGRAYWMNVTRLSLKYPHDMFGSRDGAHDTDSVGLYQQRPAYGWGNYGASTGTTDPEGVIQRLLDPRWEAMAFFGGDKSAAPTRGLLDVAGWQSMSLTYAANAVQGSNYPTLYAQWEAPATKYVTDNQDAPSITLPWYPGGGGDALACTSIPTNTALGEAGHNPFGHLDQVAISGTRVRVAGWAIEPDAINGLTTIKITDRGPFGNTSTSVFANQGRSDVNRIYNVVGTFGFIASLPWTGAGAHTFCVTVVNVGRGTADRLLGCRDVAIPGPRGAFDLAAQSGPDTIAVRGWAADPAAPRAAVQIRFTVVGPDKVVRTSTLTTGRPRADVERRNPWAGGFTGYSGTLPSGGRGDNKVCAVALNVAPPYTNPSLGCRTVMMRYERPVGRIDALSVSGRTATLAGWSFDDLQASTSIRVHIYVNSTGKAITANLARPDVNTAYRITGNHGYRTTVGIPAGTSRICVYGIGLKGNTLIACRAVTSTSTVSRLAGVGTSPAVPTQSASTEPTASTVPTAGTPPTVTSDPVSPTVGTPAQSPATSAPDTSAAGAPGSTPGSTRPDSTPAPAPATSPTDG
ncbi:hypothetical protein ACVBEQ_06330 [Nakamurella sp. GG22]